MAREAFRSLLGALAQRALTMQEGREQGFTAFGSRKSKNIHAGEVRSSSRFQDTTGLEDFPERELDWCHVDGYLLLCRQLCSEALPVTPSWRRAPTFRLPQAGNLSQSRYLRVPTCPQVASPPSFSLGFLLNSPLCLHSLWPLLGHYHLALTWTVTAAPGWPHCAPCSHPFLFRVTSSVSHFSPLLKSSSFSQSP